MKDWIASFGIKLPNDWELSKYPTPEDIRIRLSQLQQYEVSYFVAKSQWAATIREAVPTGTEAPTVLEVVSFAGDETTPLPFYFERGSPKIMIDVLNNLYSVCGPLVLLNDSGGTGIIVTPTRG